MQRKLISILISVASVVAALLIGAVMLIALGADPIAGFTTMFSAAFGSADGLAATAVKSIPLMLVGVGICIAFRANVINIGGEGQMVLGGLFGTIVALSFPEFPAFIMLPLVLLAGMVGGGIWGAIPGALKAYYNVSEILSTIMLNIVAVQLMAFLLRGPLIDPGEVERGTRIPQTARLPESSDLPMLAESLNLHAGILIAVVAAVGAWVLLWRTGLGFRLRSVGLSPPAARYAGIKVKRNIVIAIHRMVTDGSTMGFTGSAGFNGIVVALFGALHPLWTIPSSFLFGGMLVGANSLQRVAQVPAALIIALNGLIVVFVVSTEWYRKSLQNRPVVANKTEASSLSETKS